MTEFEKYMGLVSLAQNFMLETLMWANELPVNERGALFDRERGRQDKLIRKIFEVCPNVSKDLQSITLEAAQRSRYE